MEICENHWSCFSKIIITEGVGSSSLPEKVPESASFPASNFFHHFVILAFWKMHFIITTWCYRMPKWFSHSKYVSIIKSIMAETRSFLGGKMEIPQEKNFVWDTLTKISGQLRGPLAPLRGPLITERAHWAFSENLKIKMKMEVMNKTNLVEKVKTLNDFF